MITKEKEQALLNLPTPCYVIDTEKLRQNCEILRGVTDRTGCKILLAQKAYSAFATYPLIRQYINGTTSSGLYEARLGKEEFGGETHVFAPAYREQDIDELIRICDHISFNSVSQLARYADRCKENGVQISLRINPECSTQEGHAIYDPCAPGSRLGATREQIDAADPALIEMLDGLHFHTLCEQNSDAFAKTLGAVEEKFGDLLQKVKWVNCGGGHHITRDDYDIALLEKCIRHLADTYRVQVYLEPGEAVALNAGYFVTEVLDFVENHGTVNAILDSSAACHMPDVLEMPYRPPLYHSGEKGEKNYTYRLAGYTCLAGDTTGDYSFDEPLHVGSRLIFGDMAIYSMVKNNTFNGIPLPAIYEIGEDGKTSLIKEFGYDDFKNRLS